jgi:hypothetical protein
VANKPVISIDVASEPFERFKRLFDQYAQDVKSVNAEWKAMAANSNVALAPLADYADRAAKAHQRLSIAIRGTGTAMSGLVKGALHFAHAIEGITKSLVKWGSITAGAGFFGLDRLAAGVLERGRAAAGVGVTVGQQSAFRVNMSPLLGSPDTVLSAAANARQDLSKWWALSSMGINPMAAQGENPFDLALQLETRARALWKQHPNLQWAEARGLTQFFGIEDLRRMAAMPDREFAERQAAARRDVTALQFGPRETEEWTLLAVKLHRAGLEIERVLVDGLARVAPELGRLSGAAVDLIGAFFKSGEVRTGLDDLAKGIRDFAGYIASPQFRTDVRTFVDDFDAVAKKIVDGLRMLGVIPSDKDEPSTGRKLGYEGTGAATGFAVAGPPGAAIGAGMGAGVATAVGNAPFGSALWWKRLLVGRLGEHEFDPGQAQRFRPAPPKQTLWDRLLRGDTLLPGGVTKEAFRTFEQQNGLPSGLLWQIEAIESGHRADAVSRAGALGSFQLMPGTAAEYGVNPWDRISSARGAARKLRDLLNEFGGDLDKAAAAYDWGEGNLRRDIARFGKDWRAHLPRETRQYLEKIHAGTAGDDATTILRNILRATKAQGGKRSGVTVRVENNTAAQIAIQANNAVAA